MIRPTYFGRQNSTLERQRDKLCPLCLWQCFNSRLGSAKANVSVANKMFFFVFCFMLIHLGKNHKVCPKAPCRNNWWIDGIHPDYLWAASLDQKIMWMYIIILQITHNCSLRLRFTHMTISDELELYPIKLIQNVTITMLRKT